MFSLGDRWEYFNLVFSQACSKIFIIIKKEKKGKSCLCGVWTCHSSFLLVGIRHLVRRSWCSPGSESRPGPLAAHMLPVLLTFSLVPETITQLFCCSYFILISILDYSELSWKHHKAQNWSPKFCSLYIASAKSWIVIIKKNLLKT